MRTLAYWGFIQGPLFLKSIKGYGIMGGCSNPFVSVKSSCMGVCQKRQLLEALRKCGDFVGMMV